MKNLKYFCEFLIIFILFFIFKIIGYRFASKFGYLIGRTFGPNFRSKEVILKNIKNFKHSIKKGSEKIIEEMWGNYGRILAEYPYIPKFRNGKLENFIEIEGKENLEKKKKVENHLYLYLVILIILS